MKLQAPKRSSKRVEQEPRGFALVATLSLMILLGVVALGLLTLSTTELRTSSLAEHQAIAQKNARLALVMALGELQQTLGPDRRTSANADLVSSSFENTNPYWVGAWTTEGGFQNWLVSGNENTAIPADPAQDAYSSVAFGPELPPTASSTNSTGWTLGGTDAVQLVGENTAGPRSSSKNNHVFAPLVDIREIPGSPNPDGRYGWWIGDEGLKASLVAEVEPVAGNDVAETLLFRKSFPNRGFPTAGTPWDKWLPNIPTSLLDGNSGKFATLNQVSLAGLTPAAQESLENSVELAYHDFTTLSSGVLSNSKHGGLKKDLSIAFEIPEQGFRNSEFTRVLGKGEVEPDLAYATDHSNRVKSGSPLSGKSTKTAVNFQDPSWNNSFVFRGPTFDQLRDHYQLYRQLSDPFGENATIGGYAFRPNVQDSSLNNVRVKSHIGDYMLNADTRHRNNTGDNHEVTDSYRISNRDYTRIRPLTTQVVPELIRFSYVISLQAYRIDPSDPESKYRFRQFLNPFILVHNPYAVRIDSPGMWLRTKRNDLRAKLTIKKNGRKIDEFTLATMSETLERMFGEDNRLDGGYEWATDATDFYVSDNGEPSGRLVLEPGEVKLFSLTGTAEPIQNIMSFDQNHSLFLSELNDGNLNDLFTSGVFYDARTRSRLVEVDHDAKIQIEAFPSQDWHFESESRADRMMWMTMDTPQWNEFFITLTTPGLPKPTPKKSSLQYPQLRSMHFYPSAYLYGVAAHSSTSELDAIFFEKTGDERVYIGRMDTYLKPLYAAQEGDNNISLATHNPRAMVQSVTMSAAQGVNSSRAPATWSVSSLTLGALIPGFENRFWGTSDVRGLGGLQNVSIYEIPRSPLTSIASLQHVNSARLGVSPSYVIGNSYASPYLPPNQVWYEYEQRGSTFWINDVSYIYNEQFFDSYFFSGVNPGHDGSSWNNFLPGPSVTLANDPSSYGPLQDAIDKWKSGDKALQNDKLRFVVPTGLGPASAASDLDLQSQYSQVQANLATNEDVRPHNSLAAYALLDGSFNVNSTSVPAWKAVLANLRGAAVSHSNFGSSALTRFEDDKKTSFLRTSIPRADNSSRDDEAMWNGFRSLTDQDIDKLAKELVEQIKARARTRDGGKQARPFTTKAEFINRRLGPASDPFSQSGLLQEALDKTVNERGNFPSSSHRPADTKERSDRGWHYDFATNPYQNPDALANPTLKGTPQWITQADVLEAIGPQLSARSDTFTIRTYGESVEAATGEVKARAWAEARVQRNPGFVDGSDHPAIPEAELSSDLNKLYGRRFQVLSFRWLQEGEI